MKTMKRVLALTLAFVLVLAGICFTSKDGSEAKAETQSSEVNTDMLAVKAQVSTDNTAMRFITSVDSLDYASVGFEVTPAGEDAVSYTTSTVYERIVSYESNMEYQFSPKVVDTSSEYLVTAKMNVEADKLYTVRAFVVTLAGDTVYGDYRCVGVADAAGTTTNMSFTSSDASIQTGDTLTGVTYGTGSTETEATVIGVNGTTVHVRAAVAPSSLSSATKFTFSTAGSTIYRNLYTEYAGIADTTWYDAYLAADSAETEFVIATNADLYGLASIVNGGTSLENKTVYLCSDIALNDSDAVTWTSGTVASGVTPNVWTPIGTATQPSGVDVLENAFSGTFDGQNHTISGLYINENKINKALFGATSGTATVKNFSVVDSYISGNAMAASIASVGNGTFENLYSNATIKSVSSCCGGIIGRCDVSAVTIKNCWFNGTLSTTRGTSAQTGGIIGRITVTGSKLENCLNSGTVTGTSATSYQIGGLVGRFAASNLEIVDSLSVGTVKAGVAQGAILGSVDSGSVKIETTYASADVCASAVGSGTLLDAEGKEIADTTTLQVASSDITGTVASSNLEGLDFADTWATVKDGTPILKQFDDVSGKLTVDTSWYDESADTYVLYDRADLYGLSELVNSGVTFEGKTVKLGADIVINPGNANNWATNAPQYNWNPIGFRNGSGTYFPFQGTFDGDTHTISGLYLQTSARFTGLFGVIGSNATIQNVKLVNSYLSATQADLGAFVGLAQGGKIINVYTDALVNMTVARVGGLIGQINASATLERCWFDGKVTNTGNANGTRATGGLVGCTVTSGTVTITNCLNTGIVDASAYAYVQGTSMVNCLAAGMVGNVGGSTTVNISCCLNTTDVIVNEAATVGYGPVIGYADGSKTITNVYSVDTCEMVTNGKPTATFSIEELTGDAAITNLEGFDFETVWKAVEGGTPVLR